MISRRKLLKTVAATTAGLSSRRAPLAAQTTEPDFVSRRPPLRDRKFTSDAVEATIGRVKQDIADPELAWMFENCYPNGNPTRKVGLIHSMFRPSDDSCVYPFLVPSNLFAVTSLRQLSEIFEAEIGDRRFAVDCRELADEVESALAQHAVVSQDGGGRVYAYEVDGFGNALLMDDANIPNLLSLPYLGAIALDDPLYRATRKLILSEDNPYFFSGTAAEGIGGPHVGLDMIWPLGITMRALTSVSEPEIRKCLDMLKRTHGGTGFMHESFHKDDPSRFTRSWFAWANTLFGELIVKLHRERPHLLT